MFTVLYYDGLILLYLTTAILVIVFLLWRLKTHAAWWRQYNIWLSTALLSSIIFFGVIFYGSFIEPRFISVSEFQLDLSKQSPTENFRLALISDLHVGPYKDEVWLKKVADKLETLKPDAVLIAGDHTFHETHHAWYLTGLKEVTKLFPTYAVLGNHDYNLGYENHRPTTNINEERASTVAEILRASGVTVLINEAVEIKVGEKKFVLAGLDEVLTGRSSLIPALVEVDRESVPVIALAHHPDFMMLPDRALVDLALFGHTHGGQIRLPLWGAVPRLPIELGQEYDQGYFEYRGTPMIITRGIGESGTRARLFAPPEIVIIDLQI